MNDFDTSLKLGLIVHKLLLEKGIETPIMSTDPIDPVEDRQAIEKAVYTILSCLNLNLKDDSLKDTPLRVTKMFCEEIFGGLNYANFPKASTFENKMGMDEIVCVRDIVLRSTCEHHLQPIFGKIHIAYIPANKILGLSKFARIASFFGSRPQVQERLGEQIFTALAYILGTQDVAVMIDAEHFCMKMRGVKDSSSRTITSKMGGRFRSDGDAREEVVTLMTS